MLARVPAIGFAAWTACVGLAVAACASVAPSASPAASAVSPSPSPPSSPTRSLPPRVAAALIALDQPGPLAFEGSTVWALSGSDVATIDIPTGVVKLLGINSDGYQDLAATPAAVWVTDFNGSSVLRIDPATDRVVAKIDVADAMGVLPVGSSVWVTNHHEGTVTVIDQRTNRPTETIRLGTAGSNGPYRLAAGAGSVWIDEPNENQVVRLGPDAKVLTKIPVPAAFGDCGGILATATAVWVTGCHETSDIVRIDPSSNSVVARLQLAWYGADPVDVDGYVWVATSGLAGGPGELDRIDPATNTIDRRLTADALTDVGGSVVAAGDLWVANATDSVLRIPLSALAGP